MEGDGGDNDERNNDEKAYWIVSEVKQNLYCFSDGKN